MRDSGRLQAAPSFRPGFAGVALALFGLFIVYGTLIPFDFSAPPEQVATRRQLFFELTLARASRTDVVSNVLLFLPWGSLIAVFLTRRGAGAGTILLVGTASGCALSGLVEALQLFAPARVSSWIDVATNTTGSALGAALGWLVTGVIWPGVEPALRGQAERRPLVVLTAVAALGVLLASMAPFDVTLDIGELKSAVKRARLLPFSPPAGLPLPAVEPWAWAEETVMWTMLGALCALALRDARLRGAGVVVLTAAAAAGLSAFIELAQLTIQGRRSDVTSVVLAAVGAILGACAVLRHASRTPRDWVTAGLTLWALAIVLEAWTPPSFVARGRGDMTWEMLIPFLAYYRRTDVYALADIVAQTMRYLPLGALLAARPGQVSAWRVAAIGLGVGLVLEAGQFFMQDRTPEITDALSGAAGAWLGFALAKHAADMVGPALDTGRHARYTYAGAGRATARPAGTGPEPVRHERPLDVRRRTRDVWRVVRARIPKRWHLVAERINAGLVWLDAQSYERQLAAVCVGAIVFVIGFLMVLRLLGWL